MLVAQVSDLHIREAGDPGFDGNIDCGPRLQKVVALLNGMLPVPDVCLLTGDLTDNGHPAEYDRVKTILKELRIPVLAIPGNHDNRDALVEAFPASGAAMGGEFAQVVCDDYPIRLIGLDTLAEGQVGGGCVINV